MNGKDLLLGFSYIDRKYIQEGEIGRICAESSHLSLKKTVLIAAIVSLLMILAGCVAVFLGLQQRKIGELENHRKFDAHGDPLESTEGHLDLVSMAGLEGTPAWQASKEWYEFTQTYEPGELTNDPDNPNIPNNYEYTYRCWDQTMVDRLNEIAEKYDMKLLGERAVAQRWQREAAFEELGISGFIREDAGAAYSYGACRLYPPQNVICDAFITLTGENAAWTEEVLAEVYYLKSGYLAPHDVFAYDSSAQQWTYTAVDGSTVLLVLWGDQGIILHQQKHAVLVIRLDLYWEEVFLDESMALPTRETMEQLADCFDYSITTQEMAEEGLQAKLDAIPDPNAVGEDILPPEEQVTFESFAQYFESNLEQEALLYPEFLRYAWHDLDGDGQEDLLLSYEDGESVLWLTMRDGTVQPIGGFMETRLLEDGMIELLVHSEVGNYLLMKIVGLHEDGSVSLDTVRFVHHGMDGWSVDHQPVTEAEAMAAIEVSKKEPIDLPWKPLAEFPMDENGTTFGDMLAQEYHPTGQELWNYYAENCPAHQAWNDSFIFEEQKMRNYFVLQDINGDGVEDLLVSEDGQFVDLAFTVRRGKLLTLHGGFYLCRDNVMERVEEYNNLATGKSIRYSYCKYRGDRDLFWKTVIHNPKADIWYDSFPRELPTGEGEAIRAQYPREELQMRPIRELLAN